MSASVPFCISDKILHGNPEIDLAFVDCFQPVPAEVFMGYQAILSIDPGFNERRALWRIPGYLAVVNVEGAGYLNMLASAIQKYL